MRDKFNADAKTAKVVCVADEQSILEQLFVMLVETVAEDNAPGEHPLGGFFLSHHTGPVHTS
jgi:hypothetical protein